MYNHESPRYTCKRCGTQGNNGAQCVRCFWHQLRDNQTPKE